MPFDANLVCFDGTVDPMVSAAPTSATTRSGGHIALDLKKTGAKGLVMVLVCTEAFDLADSFINVSVQESDDLAAWATIAVIPPMVGANAAGSEKNAPNAAMVRFATTKRYIRANVDVGSGDDVGVCYILLASAPFDRL